MLRRLYAAALMMLASCLGHTQCLTAAQSGSYVSADGRYQCAISFATLSVPGYSAPVPSIAVDCATTPRGPLRAQAWTAGQCIALHPQPANGPQIYAWGANPGPALISLRVASAGANNLTIADAVLPGAEGAPQAWTRPALASKPDVDVDVYERRLQTCLRHIAAGGEVDDCSWSD